MKPLNKTSSDTASSRALVPAILLALIVCGGAIVRLVGLGGRSLWADEFCTWHVARMPLSESLQWGPELTKPPLYQLALRAITRETQPEEWLLRLPATIAGILTIIVAYTLARRASGLVVGLAAAGLVAFNLLQIAYSQEARPYTFHVLGATVATLFWWRLVVQPTMLLALAYVIAVVLTFHSHYLSLLVFASHALWWLMVSRRDGKWRSPIAPWSLIFAGVLCMPIVVNYLRLRTSTFQGLAWIKPPTWGVAVTVLNDLGFGLVWTVGLAAAVVAWSISIYWTSAKAASGPLARLSTGRQDVVGLLVIWLGCSWFGLLVLSWIAHPAMVDRYAIPAAIPTMLIPLVVAGRINKWIPIGMMLGFSAVGLYRWQNERLVFDPGFRELSAYLAQTIDPERDLVVLTIDRQTHPDWIDAERLPFDYYPIEGAEIGELHIDPDGQTVLNDVLEDPRQIFLIVLWADPFPILEAAGRQTLPFEIDGERFSRLLFTPYRLIRIAAKE